MPEARLVGARNCQLEPCSFWSTFYCFFVWLPYVIWSGWFFDGVCYNEEYVFFLEVLNENIDDLFGRE